MSNIDTDGYVIIRGLLDPFTVSTISKYMENKLRRGDWQPALIHRDGKNTTSEYSQYADPLIEVILEKYLPDAELHSGKELLPTYSFSRIYVENDILVKHIDRSSCEYSMSVSVAYNGEISAINTLYNGVEKSHILNPGDAILYKGCEVEHWRDTFHPGQVVVQFMLHYVDKNGPRASFRYDRRELLGQKNVLKEAVCL